MKSEFFRLALRAIVLVTAAGALACAGRTPAAPPPPPAETPAVPIDRKVGWILRLEHQRVLVDKEAGADLIALLAEPDLSLRRRTALAIGRVGLPAGVPALVKLLADTDEAVRATAAFALGLLADVSAAPPLEASLADPSPRVRGRAADALGLIGSKSSAAAIAGAFGMCGPVLASIPPDAEEAQTPDAEACKLAIFALVRLAQPEQLLRVVVGADGKPVSAWWPVAYGLQRAGDKAGADALATLASIDAVYTPAFAIRGLASLRDARAVAPAMAALDAADADVKLRVAAIRALGLLRHAGALPKLAALATDRQSPRNLALEAVEAIGMLGDPRAFTLVVDLMAASAPTMRIAAQAAAARLDPEGFVLLLSAAERDADWSVRAALAGVLGRLAPDLARAALEELASDADVRVQAPALRALAQAGSDDLERRMFAALNAPDFTLRAVAAELIGQRKPADAAPRLAAAYARGESDAAADARMAAVQAIAAFSGPEVIETLTKALGDREWSVRVRAAQLLRAQGATGAEPQRPAPLRQPPAFFESERLLRPPYSPQAYVETPSGTIQIELDVINAPLTSWSFMELSRAGFFDGIRIHRLIPNFVIQAGDPRGDGEGGPGYTLRDEFNMRPYVRGTVGMALAGPETGGSQFFIALSPQPHLDGRYTVFGRVVRGFEILDRVAAGDVITRITIVDQ